MVSALFDNAKNANIILTALKNILQHSKIFNYIEKNLFQQQKKKSNTTFTATLKRINIVHLFLMHAGEVGMVNF